MEFADERTNRARACVRDYVSLDRLADNESVFVQKREIFGMEIQK